MELKIKSYATPVAIGLGVFILILILLSAFIKPPKAFSLERVENNIQSFYASPAGYASGCGGIFRAKNAVAESKEIPEEYYSNIPNDGYIPSAPVIIPIYGYLTERGMHPSQFKFYSEESVNKDIPEQLILRTMYDTGVPVIWYDPDKISTKDYGILKTIGSDNEGKILIMPWLKYDSPTLPKDRGIAFAVFGMSQSCKTFNYDVFVDFLNFADSHSFEEKPIKPEVAELTLPELF